MKINLRKLIHKFQNYFLDLFAPRGCTGCKKENKIICENCVNLSYRFGSSCVFCNFRNNTGKICPDCKKKYEVKFEKAFWVGEYKGALKNSVKELKYKKRKELAGPLGQLIFKKFLEYYSNYAKENFLIIPIPLYIKKEYERGYNQAEIIAKEFSRISNIPSAANMLTKSFNTKTQVETKNKEERIKNLNGAFSVYDPSRAWVNKTIILIDDVATTGATFMHASHALQKAGFEKIICLAIAHGYG